MQLSGALCLGGGLVACAFSFNALRPTLLPLMRGPSFAGAALIAELGGLQLIACAAFATLFYLAGAASTLPGQVGLLLYAAAGLAAGALELRALGAARIAAEAVASLGPVTLPPRVSWRARPVPYGHGRVDHVLDVSYGPAGRRNTLDVFRPREPGNGRPVLLQIHGGAWVTGTKRTQARPLLLHMAAAGWVGFAIDYRLSPRSRWPAQLDDCKLALQWVRAHAAEHGGDPERIVVTGGSAGGHLAAMLALTAETAVAGCAPFYAPLDLVAVMKAYGNNAIASWICRSTFGCALDDRETLAKASPLSYVHAAAPPFLVTQGTADNLVPFTQTRAFVEALRGVSKQPVLYAELPGAVHAFDVFRGSRTAATVAAVHRFAEWAVTRS